MMPATGTPATGTPATGTPAEAGRAPARRPGPFRLGSGLAARWRELAAGRGLPGDLRARLALGKGERVLAVAGDPGGARAVVATERALYLRGEAGEWHRHGWELLSSVGWDAAGRRLVVAGLNGTGRGTRRTVLAPADRGRLAGLASERIAHTRLGRWALMLPGGRPAAVEARRRPVTGEPLWLVHLDGTCRDAGDRTLPAGISAVIARLSADLGIPGQEPARKDIGALLRPAGAGRGA